MFVTSAVLLRDLSATGVAMRGNKRAIYSHIWPESIDKHWTNLK